VYPVRGGRNTVEEEGGCEDVDQKKFSNQAQGPSARSTYELKVGKRRSVIKKGRGAPVKDKDNLPVASYSNVTYKPDSKWYGAPAFPEGAFVVKELSQKVGGKQMERTTSGVMVKKTMDVSL